MMASAAGASEVALPWLARLRGQVRALERYSIGIGYIGIGIDGWIELAYSDFQYCAVGAVCRWVNPSR